MELNDQQLDELAKDVAQLLLATTKKIGGTHPEILARGYVVDAAKDIPQVIYATDEGIYGKAVLIEVNGRTIRWTRYIY